MAAWLYGEKGYYRTFRPIGKEGDFYTAVSTSPFFGASIANFLCKQIEEGTIPRDAALIEIGAHQGYLMGDMIQWIFTCDPSLLETMRFIIVERQSAVQEEQRAYFAERFGDAVRLEQVSSLDALSLPYAFFVSNEIFDAFPCELYIDGKMADIRKNAVVWQDADEPMGKHVRKYGMQKGEIAVGYEAFAQRIVRAAKRFDFVSFDYGDRYARNDFSIRIYTEHTVYPFFDDEVNLSELFGRSDMTYDVNFGHVIDAFEEEGAMLTDYETQARALIRFGLIDLLEQYAAHSTEMQYLHEADKIKTLIAPNIMGERFKMVHFRK
jgi:SAM-dependent MidA family methyltransferase